MKRFFLLILLLTTFILSSNTATAGFMPYGKIFKAAKDDRSYRTQVHDSRLQLKLHKSLLINYPSSLINVSSYVFLGHGFLVGEVENDSERENLIECAKGINDLNGVSYFLPSENSKETETASALELKLKGLLEPDYPSSKLTLKVIQNYIVVLGVLDNQDQKDVLEKIKKMSGPAKIINFLQSPSAESSKENEDDLYEIFLTRV